MSRTPDALLLIGVCLALGMLVARFARPPEGLARSINWWVLYVALPALVLELIPHVHFDPQLWFLVAAMWIVFLGAWLVASLAGRLLGWSRGRIGAVTLVAGLGNTAFTGYPLIEALRGREGMAFAVVADQLGGTVILATGGAIVAALYAGHKPQARVIVQRILLFPAFVALLLGALVGALGGWPAPIDSVLARIGSTLTPLALFSVGLQFSLQLRRSQLGAVAAALGWKLALAPLAVWFVGSMAGVGGLVLAVGVLQAAMAPMISSAILANQHGLDPPVANMAVGAGILISLLTVPLANYLL